MTMVPPHQHASMPLLPRPERAPRAGECPHITHYVPWGGSVLALVCERPEGHPGKHHATFRETDGRETEFDWEPPSADELEAMRRVNHGATE